MANFLGDLGDEAKIKDIAAAAIKDAEASLTSVSNGLLDRVFAAGAAMLVAAGQALAAQLSKKAP
jgi:hypothetical protein